MALHPDRLPADRGVLVGLRAGEVLRPGPGAGAEPLRCAPDASGARRHARPPRAGRPGGRGHGRGEQRGRPDPPARPARGGRHGSGGRVGERGSGRRGTPRVRPRFVLGARAPRRRPGRRPPGPPPRPVPGRDPGGPPGWRARRSWRMPSAAGSTSSPMPWCSSSAWAASGNVPRSNPRSASARRTRGGGSGCCESSGRCSRPAASGWWPGMTIPMSPTSSCGSRTSTRATTGSSTCSRRSTWPRSRAAEIDLEVLKTHPSSRALMAEQRRAAAKGAGTPRAATACLTGSPMSDSFRARVRRKLAPGVVGKSWRLSKRVVVGVRRKLAPGVVGKSWRLSKRVLRKGTTLIR